jgi:ribosome assembly protein RRB1
MQNLRIFDTRDRSKAQIAVEAHTADVNVLSWNALTSYMLASGGDDGFLRVWDLRALDSYVASFSFHKKPICGVEWCPHESSMLATCSEVRLS